MTYTNIETMILFGIGIIVGIALKYFWDRDYKDLFKNSPTKASKENPK